MTNQGLTAEQTNALEFGLHLFEIESKRSQELGDWLMESKDKEIKYLEKKCVVLNQYVNYVQEVISLNCVPRDFEYWENFIYGSTGEK
jgi:hypothetical protein